MPDESCRRCGGELTENTKCSQCMKPNSMICRKCALCTIEQFHLICTSAHGNSDHTVLQTKSDNYRQVIMA